MTPGGQAGRTRSCFVVMTRGRSRMISIAIRASIGVSCRRRQRTVSTFATSSGHSAGTTRATRRRRRNVLLSAVCDCGADFGGRECGPASGALANALMQLPQTSDGPPHGFEVRRLFAYHAMRQLTETGLRFKCALLRHPMILTNSLATFPKAKAVTGSPAPSRADALPPPARRGR